MADKKEVITTTDEFGLVVIDDDFGAPKIVGFDPAQWELEVTEQAKAHDFDDEPVFVGEYIETNLIKYDAEEEVLDEATGKKKKVIVEKEFNQHVFTDLRTKELASVAEYFTLAKFLNSLQKGDQVAIQDKGKIDIAGGQHLREFRAYKHKGVKV